MEPTGETIIGIDERNAELEQRHAKVLRGMWQVPCKLDIEYAP